MAWFLGTLLLVALLGYLARSTGLCMVSVLGRFLEHSRVFRFESESLGDRIFVGSCDLMRRNLDARIEVLAPVLDEGLKQRVREILKVDLAPGA